MGKAIGIVGNGTVAGALTALLASRGMEPLIAVRRPGASEFPISEIALQTPVVLIAVSDDAISEVSQQLANAAVLPDVAIHTSGAAGPEALDLLCKRGVSTGVLHPLQTIPSVAAGIAALPGSTFAFAGGERARELALELIRLLEGKPLAIDPERWHFYHAAAVMASNYQVALMDAALELMEGSGVERQAALEALAPLARQTTENIRKLGTDAALTGPIRRGDLGTVLRHVNALGKAPPQVRYLYAAAANQTLKVAERTGLGHDVADRIAKAIAQTAPKSDKKPASNQNQMAKPLRVPDVVLRKAGGPKITMLTAYDASIARLLSDSGAIDILLVGDSLGMVQLGFETTVPVTMSDMIRHTRAVRAGAPDALIVADMPFLSHQLSDVQALRNAGKLVQQGGATAVKIEGGAEVASTVQRIVAAGIPVMGHVGLRPQSVHALGGFRRQARTAEEQDRLLSDALALEEAGVFAIVLEAVPNEAAATLTARLKVPVIGIGSGAACDGQVLVINDIVGLTTGTVPSFARLYANAGAAVREAAQRFAQEVRAGKFPLPRGSAPFEAIDNIPGLQQTIRRMRAAGASIGFVPTMGALHAGHAALLKRARQENDCVVASIFVNPLQFDRQDDLERYPRPVETDLQVCRDEGASVVFTPAPRELYPSEQLTFVETSALSRYLCGEHRPGHFRGVETVVLKLLNIVQPDRAYFGEKDAQQLAIIRRLVRDLNVPVSIVAVSTVREADGLALSSRNKNLTPVERSIAPVLARALRKAAEALDKGERSAEALREIALTELAVHPEVRLEYLEFTDPDTLLPLSRIQSRALLAGAIWLGATRLIDNISWSSPSGQEPDTPSAEDAPALVAARESRKY